MRENISDAAVLAAEQDQARFDPHPSREQNQERT